ncbi:MAG: hypothetical protein JO015_14525 [Verrucomicrobia bacterium]|nr:hypothetical protein [Verrucomicrobiota bacterium]
MLNAAQAALARRLQAREANITLRVNPPGVEKMSEVLLRFADPILDRSAPLEEIRATLLFAMTIWNYALLPAEARSESKGLLREVISDPWVSSVVQRLLERKAQLFADNQRMFYDLEVYQKGDELKVNVVSALPGSPTAGGAKKSGSS